MKLFDFIGRNNLSGTQRTAGKGLVYGGVALGLAVTLSVTSAVLDSAGLYGNSGASALNDSLAVLEDRLEATRNELARAKSLLEFSENYEIPADMAELIHNAALKAGVEPELAFRLVRVESRFNPRAVSSAGAVGLAQVMMNTAVFYDRGIQREDLFDPEVNLQIGLSHLRELLSRYEGNPELALLAYNRGPARVAQLLEDGHDPRNGYAVSVMGDMLRQD